MGQKDRPGDRLPYADSFKAAGPIGRLSNGLIVVGKDVVDTWHIPVEGFRQEQSLISCKALDREKERLRQRTYSANADAGFRKLTICRP